MNSRRAVFGTVVLAMALGVLVAVPLGRQRQLSVDLWLLITGLWFSLLFVKGVFDAVPVEPAERRGLWSRPTVEPKRPPKLPRDLMSLEGTVIGGRDSTRTFGRRLKPRLSDVSSHLLLSRHGIDAERQPQQSSEILGDVAWLVDPTVIDRAVTVEEMNRLLDRLGMEDHSPSNQSIGASGDS